ncbi:hypothetical protein C8R45DRAFT_1082890 [Mycena sanguinolenta]|nr:hypothetical protein C8R45DRAFT_1082890 [Mycena sanguinolenta]
MSSAPPVQRRWATDRPLRMAVISGPCSSIGGPGTIDEAMTVRLGTSRSSDVLESAAAVPGIPRLRAVKITAGRRWRGVQAELHSLLFAPRCRVHTSVVCLGRSTVPQFADSFFLTRFLWSLNQTQGRSNHGNNVSIRHVQRQRTAVLREYPTDELLQLYAVVRFFRGILEDTCVAYPNCERLPIDVFQCSSCSRLAESGIVNVFSTLGPDGVKRVWDERAYDSLAGEIAKKTSIGTKTWIILFLLERCLLPVCSSRRPVPTHRSQFELAAFFSPKFSLITFVVDRHRTLLYPGHLLKGKLRQTATIQKYLLDAIYTHARDDCDEGYGPWIANVFAVPETTEWDGWTKDKSYLTRSVLRRRMAAAAGLLDYAHANKLNFKLFRALVRICESVAVNGVAGTYNFQW